MAIIQEQRVRFGPFEVDLRSGELFKNGSKVNIQPQPMQLLRILLEHPGELVTREELRQRLWPTDTFVDFEQGLNTAVKKLRLAFGDEAETPRYIETLPRRGYRFIAEVTSPHTPEPAVLPSANEAHAAAALPPTALPPAPAHAEVRKFKSRAKVMIAGLAGVLVLGAVFAASYRHMFRMTPRIVGSRQLTHTRLEKARGFPCYLATDGSRVYFQEHRGNDEWVVAQVSVSGGEPVVIPAMTSRYPCLLHISPSGSDLLLRHDRIWDVPLPSGGTHALPVQTGGWALWTPDGRDLIYTGAGDKDLFRSKADGTEEHRLFSANDFSWVRVSPDGQRVRWTQFSAGATKIDIWEANIDGSNAHPLFPEMAGQTFFGDWTRDGELFFFYRRNGPPSSLWALRDRGVLARASSKPTLLYAGPLAIYSATPSKDSKTLYVVGVDRRGELSVYDSKTAKFVPYANGVSACFVTFSPDRQWIAYVSYPDGFLWKSRIDGSEKVQLTFSSMALLNPRWSPDGKFIVFMDWFALKLASEHNRIYVIPAEGGQPRLLLSGQSEPIEPADPTWSPDSRLIAYGGDFADQHKTIRLLDLNTMKSREVPGSEGLLSPRWSPDGKYIVAFDDSHRQMMVYSFADEKWRALAPKESACGWQAWSHDSKYVFAYCNADGNFIRTNIATNAVEKMGSLKGTPWTALRTGEWFDLTPDDRIMIMRNTGTEDVYALQLEY